jgi:Domain of unknown function (DUF4192)
MNTSSNRPPLRVSTPAGLLAVIPYVLGFTPTDSLVVIGVGRPVDCIRVALRYDLPDPPDAGLAAEIAAHATGVLARQHVTDAVVAGYGPGRLVTPVADATRQAASGAGVVLRDVLRVDDGRYWSYLCREPSCCPADGVSFDAAAHPAAKLLASFGMPVLSDRPAVAASIAPVSGPEAAAMAKATRQAERVGARLIAGTGPAALDVPGLAAVQSAIEVYREGGSIIPAVGHAWLALVLTRLRIRDDAWARMDPAHHGAHRRLWTDLVRRAQPGYVAAPACLLAVTTWQGGDGALANLALDRALADIPGYSMALVLRDTLAEGIPPSAAAPPMTPEEVATSYASPTSGQLTDAGERTDSGGPTSST